MSEEWEEKLLKRLEEVFRSMGMPIDIVQLRGMLEQFRDQFESMGIDPERLSQGDVNFNFDISNLMKVFQSGVPLDEMISNLGVDMKVDAKPVEIEIEEADDDESMLVDLTTEDIHLEGWNMVVTIDCHTKVELEENELVLALADGGSVLQVLDGEEGTAIARMDLPHRCEDLVEWSMNNGILDITLRLSPQGIAMEVDEEQNDDSPDHIVSIDLGEDDEDDEDDDGGIPIL